MEAKSFSALETLDDLNRANDEQKSTFAAMVAADPNLIETRITAYLRRWSEALPHITHGQSILDIGAGWPLPQIMDAIFARGVKYHVIDIDAGQVSAWSEELVRRGQDVGDAKQSPNTVLPFSDASMDFIFSSHCIEHSTDLSKTFAEMRRVLRDDGKIYFSVPFGFDDSDEHLLFLGRSEWLYACELAGFVVKSWTVGNTYTDGWDLSILLEKGGTFDEGALSALDKAYQKPGKRLLRGNAPAFAYKDLHVNDGYSFCSSFTLSLQADHLLIMKHAWSGIVRLTDATGSVQIIDLFDRGGHVSAIPVENLTAPITGEICAKNSASKADQLVIYGALVRS